MPNDSMFNPGQTAPADPATGSNPAGAAPAGQQSPSSPPAGAPPAGGTQLPDWVHDKYRTAENPIEAQARAYPEAMSLVTRRREEIAAEVKEQLTSEMRAGLPENAEGYTYPEGWKAPAGEIDTAFRGWAHANGVKPEAFQKLVELYGQSQMVDISAEKAKLGAQADTRIAAVSGRLAQMIPTEMHGTVARVMGTAEGFMLMEKLIEQRSAPSSPSSSSMAPPMADTYDGLRVQLRDRMADPRYHDRTKRDPAFVRETEALAERAGRLRPKSG